MGSKPRTWPPANSMILLAFAVYSKEHGHDDFLQKAPQHLQPVMQGKMVSKAAVLSQLSRTGTKLHLPALSLGKGDMEAINSSTSYLTNEERDSLQDELEKLFRPRVPPVVHQSPGEQLERHRNTKSDNIMVENSMKPPGCSTITPFDFDAPPSHGTKRLRTSSSICGPLPTRQLGVQGSSLQVQSGPSCDADQVALQREIDKLREEKRILEQLSTQTQKQNNELHMQLIGAHNSYERLEVEHALTTREMNDLRLSHAQRPCNKLCGQSQGDIIMGQIQPAMCSRDADRTNELYDDLLSPMVLARHGISVLASLSTSEVLKQWQLCQARLNSLSFGTLWRRGAIKPETVPPGFFSFLSKLYGRTEKVPIHEPWSCLPLLENSNKRNVLKSYAMDNLCESVFQRSDFHDFDKTKCRMLEKYRYLIAATTDGFQTLQKLDAAALKALLAESGGYLRKNIVEEEARKIVEKVDADLAPFFMDAPTTDGVSQRQTLFRGCAENLLNLKFELLLANKEYEIHFREAGPRFDSSTMIATSFDGCPVEGGPLSKVQFCVYPALVQHDSVAAADAKLEDFSGVLRCNKSFYPINSIRQGARVIAEATVLLA